MTLIEELEKRLKENPTLSRKIAFNEAIAIVKKHRFTREEGFDIIKLLVKESAKGKTNSDYWVYLGKKLRALTVAGNRAKEAEC